MPSWARILRWAISLTRVTRRVSRNRCCRAIRPRLHRTAQRPLSTCLRRPKAQPASAGRGSALRSRLRQRQSRTHRRELLMSRSGRLLRVRCLPRWIRRRSLRMRRRLLRSRHLLQIRQRRVRKRSCGHRARRIATRVSAAALAATITDAGSFSACPLTARGRRRRARDRRAC